MSGPRPPCARASTSVREAADQHAREARELEQLARQRSLVLMEAYHNLHHPLATRMRELVRSGELGQLTSLSISSGLPGPDGFAPLLRDKLGLPPAQAPPAGKTSQRKAKMDVELGGGKFLGQGCYTVSMARWLVGDDAAGEDGGYDGGYDGGLYTSEHPSARNCRERTNGRGRGRLSC